MPSTPYLDVSITADGEEVYRERINCEELLDDPSDLVKQHHEKCVRAFDSGAQTVTLSVTDPDGALPPLSIVLRNELDPDVPEWPKSLARLLVRAHHESDIELLDTVASLLYLQPALLAAVMAHLAKATLEVFVGGTRPGPPDGGSLVSIVVADTDSEMAASLEDLAADPRVHVVGPGQEAPVVVRLVEAAFRIIEPDGFDRYELALEAADTAEKGAALGQVLRIAAETLPHGRPAVEAALAAERGDA